MPRVPLRERVEARRWRLTALVGLVAVAAAIVAGVVVAGGDGDGGDGDAPPKVPEASGGAPAQRTSFLAKLIPPAEVKAGRGRGPRVPRSLSDLARRLALERKVAQLMLVGFKGTTLTAPVFGQLQRLDFGGIVIDEPNYTGPHTLGLLAGEAIAISQQAKHVPPWVMAAQEGGEFNAFPDLPPALAPADIATAEQAGALQREAARTLRPLGVTGFLAPVLDVGPETEPVLGQRVYSDDPGDVAAFARATVGALRRGRIFSAVKHFPGLGSATQPTEEGPASVGLSLDELRERDLIPFVAAFKAGAPAVVLSHAFYAVDDFTRPGSLSSRIATDLLRKELRFRGVAITDDLADPPISAQLAIPDAAVRAVKAGADMVFISGPAGDQQAAYAALLRAVRRREISRGRLDQALLRILAAKRRFGLIR